jgi:hypothetical protein
MVATPFISYTHEDADAANKLYDELRRHGVRPWLDSTNIVAGEYWPTVVKVAIWSASHIILLISSRSIAKEGYVQREVREAIDRLQRMPPGQCFVIPVRLDKCDIPYEELESIHRINMYEGWEHGILRIVAALRASEIEAAALKAGVWEHDLMTELKQGVGVGGDRASSAAFGKPLATRAEVYAEAVRLVVNAGIHDDARATATIFDNKETTDHLFMTYLNLIALKCRDAEEQGGSFEHHALFSFARDAAGRIPDGVNKGLEIRRQVFLSHNVLRRLHLYHISEPMLDMLLVGRNRALIAFPESPSSSRLLHGVSAIDLKSVSSLANWYMQILSTKAVQLSEE